MNSCCFRRAGSSILVTTAAMAQSMFGPLFLMRRVAVTGWPDFTHDDRCRNSVIDTADAGIEFI